MITYLEGVVNFKVRVGSDKLFLDDLSSVDFLPADGASELAFNLYELIELVEALVVKHVRFMAVEHLDSITRCEFH